MIIRLMFLYHTLDDILAEHHSDKKPINIFKTLKIKISSKHIFIPVYSPPIVLSIYLIETGYFPLRHLQNLTLFV